LFKFFLYLLYNNMVNPKFVISQNLVDGDDYFGYLIIKQYDATGVLSTMTDGSEKFPVEGKYYLNDKTIQRGAGNDGVSSISIINHDIELASDIYMDMVYRRVSSTFRIQLATLTNDKEVTFDGKGYTFKFGEKFYSDSTYNRFSLEPFEEFSEANFNNNVKSLFNASSSNYGLVTIKNFNITQGSENANNGLIIEGTPRPPYEDPTNGDFTNSYNKSEKYRFRVENVSVGPSPNNNIYKASSQVLSQAQGYYFNKIRLNKIKVARDKGCVTNGHYSMIENSIINFYAEYSNNSSGIFTNQAQNIVARNCFVDITKVENSTNVSGILGSECSNFEIDGCYVRANNIKSDNFSGIAGNKIADVTVSTTNTIKNCYTDINVVDVQYTCGIVGQNALYNRYGQKTLDIQNCYSVINIDTDGRVAYGIVGEHTSSRFSSDNNTITLSNCYSIINEPSGEYQYYEGSINTDTSNGLENVTFTFDGTINPNSIKGGLNGGRLTNDLLTNLNDVHEAYSKASGDYYILNAFDATPFNSSVYNNYNDAVDFYVEVLGCTDSAYDEYDATANTDDGSCATKLGCTNPRAANYVADASKDDGSCSYVNDSGEAPNFTGYDATTGTLSLVSLNA
jgi:hypothetical protein